MDDKPADEELLRYMRRIMRLREQISKLLEDGVLSRSMRTVDDDDTEGDGKWPR